MTTRPTGASQKSAQPLPDQPSISDGMLLLDPDYHGDPAIWAVLPNGSLIAHHGGRSVQVTLNERKLPDGWRILDNRRLAELIAEDGS